MKERKIAISDCDHVAFNEEITVFSQSNVKMDLYQCKTEEDLIEKLRGYEVIGNQYAPMTEKVFKELKELNTVVRYGVGVDHIDLKAATKYGVTVCNVPDYGVHEVASHALTLMLALTRKLIKMNRSTKEGSWKYEESIPVFRYGMQTVGIIGIGRIGMRFAQFVNAIGCKVVATDPLFAEGKRLPPDYVKIVSLEELLCTADVVSLHCPLDTSRDLIDEKQLKMMKPSAFLINVSRGGIVNEAALEKALKNNWIAGAACDVLATEPPVGIHPLMKYDSFICTPHMAWYSEQAASDLKLKLAQEMVRAIDGKTLFYRLN